MQSNFLFRVVRGLAVVVGIVVAHFVIVYLFQNMRIPAPDLGPVYATLSVEPRADSDQARPSRGGATAASKPQEAPADEERERPAAAPSNAPDKPGG